MRPPATISSGRWRTPLTWICLISAAGTAKAGTPIVTVKDDYNPETEQYTLTISQRTPPTAEQEEKHPLHIPFSVELYDNEGNVIPLQKGGHPVHNVL